MAGYGITNYFKGGTKAQYDATIKAVHPDGGKGLPAGQTYHAAGPTDHGFLVVAIWDSKDTWEKFRDGTLVPTLGSLDGALPGPPTGMEFEIHNEITA
ncbi:MAG: hypothetical protein MUP97_06800 [Acidimicrobiia bacterium]|nr:hypothetical protein [Acidimicrobiia bacterium]